eukprot:gene4764-5391_t
MAASKDESELSKENRGGEEEGSWWSSWGKSLYDSVKEKTNTTMVMVQKDLSEFYQTIQSDTAVAVVDTAGKVQQKIETSADDENGAKASFKQGISSILSSVSSSLKTLTQEDPPGTEDATDGSLASPVYNRGEMKIKAIQSDISTYCNEPEGLSEEFANWLEGFDFDSQRAEMSDLLVKNPEIRAVYSRLVPAVVSHRVFWQRYFYKIHQFKQEEERRAALVARADSSNQEEQEYNWDSDDGEECIDEQPKPVIDVEVMAKNAEEDFDVESKREVVCEAVKESELDASKDTQDEPSFEVAEDAKPLVEAVKESTTKKDVSSVSAKEAEVESTDHVEAKKDDLSTSSSPCKEECSSSDSSVEVVHTTSQGNATSCSQEKGNLEPSTATHSGTSLGGSKTSLGPKARLKSVEATSLMQTSSIHDQSETSSTGSWISVDDEIRVRKSRKDKHADEGECAKSKQDDGSKRNSDSSHSSAVIVEKDDGKRSDVDDDDDDDEIVVDDFELDEDINDEELQKIMQKISDKSGNLDDDDDWEDWE